jgi:hypothetical protein
VAFVAQEDRVVRAVVLLPQVLRAAVNPRKVDKVRGEQGRRDPAVRVVVVRVDRAGAAASTSTTCSNVCRPFQSPM